MRLAVGLLPLLLLSCLPAPLDVVPAATAAVPDAAPDDAPALAPLSMVDPDGQALTLEALTANVYVEGALSLTELELVFKNPQDRRIEGRFALTLPDGATVSRFAKTVDGRLMEGEVVERMAAHRAYDTILQQMRDPALLEMDAGNRFAAKVFPIEPGAEVRIVLSYTRLLRREDGARAYVLPLRGLPAIGRFTFHGRFAPLPGVTADLPGAERGSDGVQHLDLAHTAWAPDRDVAVRWRTSGKAPRVQVLRAGDYTLTSFSPDVPAATDGPAKWAFYVDTSASGGDAIAPRIAALQALLRSLPPSTPVRVSAFDQDVAALDEGRAGDVAVRIGEKLERRGFLGGTDLGRALADVAAKARPDTRVVLVTDGVPTFGETNPAKLAEAARALPARVQLHALVLGPEQDGAMLGALTEGRGRVVEVPFGPAMATDAARAAERLAQAPGARLQVDAPGAQWVHAVGNGDVLPGGEVFVVAKGGEAPRLLRGRDVVLPGGDARDAGAARPLVEREAVRLHLLDLARREAEAPSEEARAALAAEQVDLSTRHRVLCPKTTMLVLESEADYARFGIDRRALADVLTVGKGGLAVVSREGPAGGGAPKQEPIESKVVEERDERLAADDGAPADEELEEAKKEAKADEAPEAEMAEVSSIAGPPAPSVSAEPAPRRARLASPQEESREDEAPAADVAWTKPTPPSPARLAELEARLAAAPRDRAAYNQLADALLGAQAWARLDEVAGAWQVYDPENPHVYELLGEAALARGDRARAVRAFASLAEVAAGRPELLQRAGLLLWRAGDAAAAEVPLRRAVELRPDRANAWRHLALVLRAAGRFADAADVLDEARRRAFPDTYQNVGRVLDEELGAVLRDWIAAGGEADARARAKASGVAPRAADALRVTLAWETDGNDVDLHVVDPAGEACFYGHRQTRSGLELYDDLTRGLGPEVIRASKLPKGRYIVGVKYFSAGPMGVSRGLVIVEQAGQPPRVEPFRLVEGGGDVRYVTALAL